MINRTMRLVSVGALAVGVAVSPVGSPRASADSTLAAYNITLPDGVPTARAVAIDPASHRVYVGSSSGAVYVLDGLTGSTITTIPLLYVPTSVAVDSATNRLFVFGAFTSHTPFGRTFYMTIVDTTTNSVISTLPEPYSLPPLVIDSANRRILALPSMFDEAGNKLSVPPGLMTFVNDDAFAVDPGMQRAYVMTTAAGTVTVYNSATYKLIATVHVSASPTAIAVDPSTHQVYVSDLNHGVVSVINATTDAVSTSIQVDSPSAIAVDSAAGLVYVNDLPNIGASGPPFPAASVTVIDTTHDTVLRSVSLTGVAGNGSSIAVDPVTRTVWVAGNQLTEVDPAISRRASADRCCSPIPTRCPAVSRAR